MHLLAPPRIHRDLKPENILLKNDLSQIALSDFGTLYLGTRDENVMKAISPYYSPPEYIWSFITSKPIDQSPKSDNWSIGMILYRIFYGKLP